MKLNLLFLYVLLNGSILFSQDLSSYENQLFNLLEAVRNAKTDAERNENNTAFKTRLYQVIQLPGAMDYPFSSLRSIGMVKSPDNYFRFFNWNVEQEDMSQKYYCYILRYDVKKKENNIIELLDNSLMLSPEPDDYLDENNWYGALYYKIIPTKRSGKTIYTLLGYDANNSISHTKLIDAISFTTSHIRLGSPIFKYKDKTYKRMFFEHSKKSVMSMTYNEEREKIIFDHLSPESPTMEGFKEFYVPDMSYDAFKMEGNKWVLEEDIIAINRKSADNKSVVSYDLDKDGNMVESKKKSKWIDPSNKTAPGGQNVHKPAVPDDLVKNGKKKTKKTKSKEKDDFPEAKKKKKQVSGIGSIPRKRK
jgi:hypothetical protein